MNPQTCYEENIANILSVDDSKTVKLKMPQKNAASEGQELSIVLEEDNDALIARGMNPEFVNELPVRIAAFTYAAALYELDVQNVSDIKLKWEEKKEKGYKLKKKLITEMEFAFRNNPLALMKLKEIKNGKGHRDMLLDLLELEILGRDFPDDLNKTDFDTALLDEAKALHEEVTLSFAEMRVRDNKINETLIIRDKAYTWLKEIMDEVRAYGKFVFHDNPERQKRYISEFYHELGSHPKNQSSDTEIAGNIAS